MMIAVTDMDYDMVLVLDMRLVTGFDTWVGIEEVVGCRYDVCGDDARGRRWCSWDALRGASQGSVKEYNPEQPLLLLYNTQALPIPALRRENVRNSFSVIQTSRVRVNVTRILFHDFLKNA